MSAIKVCFAAIDKMVLGAAERMWHEGRSFAELANTTTSYEGRPPPPPLPERLQNVAAGTPTSLRPKGAGSFQLQVSLFSVMSHI